MSVPHFNAQVALPAAGFVGPQRVPVSGPLGEEDEARELYLFVVVQQTANDRAQPLPGAGAAAIAIAKSLVGPINVDAQAQQNWEATMTVPVGQTFFVRGSATGTALAVEYSLDANNSIGFETYAWTQRLRLN